MGSVRNFRIICHGKQPKEAENMWDFCAFLEGYHLVNPNVSAKFFFCKCFWRHLPILLSMAVLSSRVTPPLQSGVYSQHINLTLWRCMKTTLHTSVTPLTPSKLLRIPNTANSHIQIKFPSAEWERTYPKKAAQTPSHFLIPKTETCMIYPAAKPAVLISKDRHKCPVLTLEMKHLGICSTVFTVTQAGDGISHGLEIGSEAWRKRINFWDNRKKITPNRNTHKSGKMALLHESAINDALWKISLSFPSHL